MPYCDERLNKKVREPGFKAMLREYIKERFEYYNIEKNNVRYLQLKNEINRHQPVTFMEKMLKGVANWHL